MKKQEYLLETEYGFVSVSKKEFNDVKSRVNGEYGSEFKKDPNGINWYWVEETNDNQITGYARREKAVKTEEPRSKFEIELMRLFSAGESNKALKHIDSWQKRGFKSESVDPE